MKLAEEIAEKQFPVNSGNVTSASVEVGRYQERLAAIELDENKTVQAAAAQNSVVTKYYYPFDSVGALRPVPEQDMLRQSKNCHAAVEYVNLPPRGSPRRYRPRDQHRRQQDPVPEILRLWVTTGHRQHRQHRP